MRRHVVAAVRMLIVLTVLTGIVYPLGVLAVARVGFAQRAEGSLVRVGGRVVGSALLGQRFDGPQWFHPRPGAYDPALSGASNLATTNPEQQAEIAARAAAIRAVAPGAGALPADALTGSGSGLDPDVSIAYARLQAPRVAAARGLPLARVRALVEAQTQGRTFGFLGEPRVNVLLLNLALEGLASSV